MKFLRYLKGDLLLKDLDRDLRLGGDLRLLVMDLDRERCLGDGLDLLADLDSLERDLLLSLADDTLLNLDLEDSLSREDFSEGFLSVFFSAFSSLDLSSFLTTVAFTGELSVTDFEISGVSCRVSGFTPVSEVLASSKSPAPGP